MILVDTCGYPAMRGILGLRIGVVVLVLADALCTTAAIVPWLPLTKAMTRLAMLDSYRCLLLCAPSRYSRGIRMRSVPEVPNNAGTFRSMPHMKRRPMRWSRSCGINGNAWDSLMTRCMKVCSVSCISWRRLHSES